MYRPKGSARRSFSWVPTPRIANFRQRCGSPQVPAGEWIESRSSDRSYAFVDSFFDGDDEDDEVTPDDVDDDSGGVGVEAVAAAFVLAPEPEVTG
jgi:hypothetical protein